MQSEIAIDYILRRVIYLQRIPRICTERGIKPGERSITKLLRDRFLLKVSPYVNHGVLYLPRGP